jgi:hypothetical protein
MLFEVQRYRGREKRRSYFFNFDISSITLVHDNARRREVLLGCGSPPNALAQTSQLRIIWHNCAHKNQGSSAARSMTTPFVHGCLLACLFVLLSLPLPLTLSLSLYT